MKYMRYGKWWEIQTDPNNAEYVMTNKGARRDYGENNKEEVNLEEEMRFLSEEEKGRRRVDAFANFEGKFSEKERKD